MKRTESPAGRLDILAERILERVARQLEADTGLSGLWEAAAPGVRRWTARHLGPKPRRRTRKAAR